MFLGPASQLTSQNENVINTAPKGMFLHVSVSTSGHLKAISGVHCPLVSPDAAGKGAILKLA